jgi:hypothetical protein
MGTTVTPNLSLIKPDINESIKQALPTFQGWATQNQINSNIIDGLFRCDSGVITPTFAPSGGGLVLGSGGFVQSKYVRIAPRMALNFFIVDFGTTGFAAGTGTYRYTAFTPTIDPIFNGSFSANGGLPLGMATYYDSSAIATSSVFTPMWDTVNNRVFFRCPDGSFWTATNPVALGQSDRISGYIMYPTTDA